MSKGCDKQVAAYEKAIEKIPGAKIYGKNGKEPPKPTTKEGSDLPAEKFKWYEFRKRFKSWNQRRKNKKDEKDEGSKDETKESKTFRDAYKYDVFKDYVDKSEKDILAQARKDMKKEAKDARDSKDDGSR